MANVKEHGNTGALVLPPLIATEPTNMSINCGKNAPRAPSRFRRIGTNIANQQKLFREFVRENKRVWITTV